MFEGLNNLGKVAEDFKKKMQAEAKAMVVEGGKELFAKYPQLLAVKWNQYTPGFNDGDACYHSMGEVTFKFSEESGINGAKDGWYSDREDEWCYPSSRAVDPVAQDCDKFSSALHGIDDALEMAFGTNQEITVNKDGTVEVEDYDCGH